MNIDVTFEQTDMSFAPEMQTGMSAVAATFFPSVSEEGVISWTNNGNLPNPAPINIQGKAGPAGEDGHTPVRGTDYWTEEDKTQMVADVISALPVYNGEVV